MFNRSSEGVNNQYGAVIRVIGYRSSGKTTFMAALARWPNASNTPVQSVMPTNDDGQELINKARNILEQGEQLEPTKLDADINEIKDYGITIKLIDRFSWIKPKMGEANRVINLNISCKDYAGEFFDDLLQPTNNILQPTNNIRLDSYLEDCVLADGIALLIDGYSHQMDSEYEIGLKKFLNELLQNEATPKPRRIAVILTKAEQGEIWANRNLPARTIISRRFPKVYELLQGWHDNNERKVDFFRASAFGTLGGSSAPNATIIRRKAEGTTAVIKKPKLWKPFGLISPFYWLCTGERHRDLDKD